MKVSPVAAVENDADAAAKKAAADAAAQKVKDEADAKKRAEGFNDTMGKHAPNLSPNGGEGGDDDDDEAKASKSLNSSLALARMAGIGGYAEKAKT